MTHPVLSVRNLVVDFPDRRQTFRALDGVSFDIAAGEIVGVVGESGAGKSMTGAAIIQLIQSPGRIVSGEILLNGVPITGLPQAEVAALRGKRIGLITQDPLTSLNPLFTIGQQMIETIRRHLPLSESQARTRAIDLLSEAGISDAEDRLGAYPHQFSGGMRQRVVIALAIAAEPELIVADEPTSALDVSVQAQIIGVLKALCERRGTAVMMITHDMGVVAETADRVVVMNKGRIVETGKVADIIRRPSESYTRGLIAAIPSVADARDRKPVAAGVAPLVEVQGLCRDFRLPARTLRQRFAAPVLRAVADVTFEIPRGTTFGLVGESGSGKSTCARMIAGLLPPSSGEVLMEGARISGRKGMSGDQRRRVQMIFQDPYASLNPRWRIRDIVAEPLHGPNRRAGRRDLEEQVAELLRKVRMEPDAMFKFPHQFSGGQRQRIAIARALSSEPEFIICDEPTSALDVSVQAQVLDLMASLQEELGLTYLLISHDLAVVRRMSDFIGVMQRGRLVEKGDTDQVFDAPQDPYTRMLLDSILDISKVA
ncbi:dipeptide ABC transporter ATP-binding protein [Alloyangia pacifica]|uniref:Peptide/nickel transport system ATP-binding protein n=1 Tax=Alloyangia pacifica TaxID=311180 RepID=A0A1I6WG25_9RHOB|nr:ABC transporter ATP-binding protein [Alloyangia pacifica]SDI72266.1 peptide/nickel transport system ATP-binding protein [Alloyangia pacifica]SFT24892.1 peptide/nickel transport system ATP-binding protein [Alloyangia pacifica]